MAFQGFKQHMADGINVTWLYKRQATGAWPELVHGYTCLGTDFLEWKRKLADLAKGYRWPMKFQFSSGRDAYNILKWLMN